MNGQLPLLLRLPLGPFDGLSRIVATSCLGCPQARAGLSADGRGAGMRRPLEPASPVGRLICYSSRETVLPLGAGEGPDPRGTHLLKLDCDIFHIL